MITAVDTNVLLDVFGADPRFGPRSSTALRACLREGRVLACDVVWTETASLFPSTDAALDGATAWRAYRQGGGRRERVAADFLIGAHALRHADRLLTRDRGFYRRYFGGLPVLDPSRA